jgi:transcriptional regulator with XRE-family HTH domain
VPASNFTDTANASNPASGVGKLGPLQSGQAMTSSSEEKPRSHATAAQPELRVGQKLKAARKAHRLHMRDLAERVGCSESLISKIENDKVFPSLPMLHKIAAELGTSIGKMFAEANPEGEYVSRKGKRPVLSLNAIGRDAGVGIQLEAVAINGELLYGSIHIVDAGGSSGGFIEHVGEEVGYVLEGQIEITLSGKAHLLNEGDSIFFPSELPHGYRNPGDRVARILWINTPPTF